LRILPLEAHTASQQPPLQKSSFRAQALIDTRADERSMPYNSDIRPRSFTSASLAQYTHCLFDMCSALVALGIAAFRYAVFDARRRFLASLSRTGVYASTYRPGLGILPISLALRLTLLFLV
jgi:hypothetical protein